MVPKKEQGSPPRPGCPPTQLWIMICQKTWDLTNPHKALVLRLSNFKWKQIDSRWPMGQSRDTFIIHTNGIWGHTYWAQTSRTCFTKRETFLRLLQGQDMQTLSSKQLYCANGESSKPILPGKVKSCSPFKISQLKACRKYYTTNVDVPKNLKIIGPCLRAQSVHENTTFVEAVPHWFFTCRLWDLSVISLPER